MTKTAVTVLGAGGEFEDLTGPMISVLRPKRYDNETYQSRVIALEWKGEYPRIGSTILIDLES